MRFYIGLHVLVMMSIALDGCGNSARDTEADKNGEYAVSDSMNDLKLVLPEIPSTISTPEDKAGFIAIHFWDGLDFNDTAKSMNREFMEQNFVEYISIMPAVMASDRQDAFKVLIKKSSARADTRKMISDFGRKYLANPDSPMKNPEYYKDFLDAQK
ncbi:MAG: DUF5106 domain-containing protein [Bacteroides sp.]|nr:DUF5106 domain-containing protein [Bacteroides sp.]